jgi:xanthine dehydrogenase accessory factor
MATKELQAILSAYSAAQQRGRAAALVTVVKTSGSTYRRPGARMLVLEGGALAGIGLISGGCLEDDARDRALEVIASGVPRLIRYDTTADGDILFGTGVGCQGVVQVLIEPLPAPDRRREADPLGLVARAFQARRAAVLASVFAVGEPAGAGGAAPGIGDFLCLDEASADSPVSNLADAELARAIARDARAALAGRRPAVQTYRGAAGQSVEVFIDVIPPPRALLICGAGEDAVPLARLAKELGWRVRVADPRSAYATRERFPDSDEVIVCPSAAFSGRIPIESGEAAMLMTHNFRHDQAILEGLLGSEAAYIGVLGPARRTARLLSAIAAAAGAPETLLGRKSLRRVYGPAGLDIGAEAPEQIALSILAEIQAVGARRRGGALKRRRGPLHAALA